MHGWMPGRVPAALVVSHDVVNPKCPTFQKQRPQDSLPGWWVRPEKRFLFRSQTKGDKILESAIVTQDPKRCVLCRHQCGELFRNALKESRFVVDECRNRGCSSVEAAQDHVRGLRVTSPGTLR